MRKAILLLIIVASFAGCRKEKLIGPKEGDTYVHLLFPDEASCNQFRQSIGGMVFNCHQSISFNADNRADMMVTDIMNRGNYTQIGKIIMIDFDGPNDVGREVVLEVIDENTLLDTQYGTEWKRCKGPTAWDLY